VQYEHRIFQSQLAQIRDYYGIKPGDIDQPAFPLFALFSIALGACSVIPDMDPSCPAKVDPQKFINSIEKYGVNYSFGSPAIWEVVGRYCQARRIKLPSLKKVLMAGAPVSGELLKVMFEVLPDDGEVHIPYGATESLPVISMRGREVVAETWPLTVQGRGACVGRPLPGIKVRIIEAVDGPVADIGKELPNGEIGEIIVVGEVVTKAYFNNDSENRLAKIADADGFWHRIGDVGYFDEQGCLWFCGRKAHRVMTPKGILYTICCEAVFNQHPLVRRSALVGVGKIGKQSPVLIVEPYKKISDPTGLMADLQNIALAHEHTTDIKKFMIHTAFPVDIRHNAKIFREKLAQWAAGGRD
jgi:acyl-coenzyme A synthetase/AMP-(fatty) acid ligase